MIFCGGSLLYSYGPLSVASSGQTPFELAESNVGKWEPNFGERKVNIRKKRILLGLPRFFWFSASSIRAAIPLCMLFANFQEGSLQPMFK
jgi:hypothetical protein